MTIRSFWMRLLTLTLTLMAFGMAATVAHAIPDETGYTVIDESTGFPGLCPPPCYSAGKSFEFWLHDNPNNPLPSPLADNHTYVYKLEHLGGTSVIFVPGIVAFDLSVDNTQVTDAGFILGSPGTAPSSTAILAGRVRWDFLSLPIRDGETSALLYIHSPLLPGGVSDSLVGVQGQLSLAATGTCKGPLIAPPSEVCSVSIAKEGCVVQPPDVTGDSCQGKLEAFCYEYTGLGCDASSNLQNPKKTYCAGGAAGQGPVSIIVASKKRKRWSWSHDWWGKKHKKKTIFSAESNVQVGDVICADASNAGKHHFGSKSYIKISDGSGHHDIIEVGKFHTSCSQPFALGNQFGSIKVVSITSTDGGLVSLEQQQEAANDACVTEIDQVPPPHCQGKVTKLSLRYTGTDCTATLTSQDGTHQSCTDTLAPTGNPARITLESSADQSSPPLFDGALINMGDIFEITAAAGSQLESVTGFTIRDTATDALIQDGLFHTSCSQPLNLGDQFGSLQVYGLETTNGGSVTLGSDVEYTYTVTNDSEWPLFDVTVNDNKLGNIVTGDTLAALSQAVYTASASIEAQTTNIATVTATGTSSGTLACLPGEASATITVAAPPIEPTVCSKKIAATLLRYTGPDLLGATVVFDAKAIDEDVVYGPVDLIGGVTVLSTAGENGYTIDGTGHGESSLGSKLRVFINGVEEELHTSCSTPFVTDAPAPLNEPKGAPSANWYVVDFSEKASDEDHDHHHGNEH